MSTTIISTTINHGITLGSTYLSPLTITSTGAINNKGTAPGIFGGTGTVVNDGHITATSKTTVSFGVTTVSAYSGIYLSDSGAFLNNSGTITGSLYAVQFTSGGSIINSGVLYGGRWGVESRGLISVMNTGTISGSNHGIVLSGGGFVGNNGLISGPDAIGISGTAGTVVNTGTITGYSEGVGLLLGGMVSNASTGLISVTGVGYAAVYVGNETYSATARGVITNAGTIIGYTGVSFYATNALSQTLIDSGTIIGTGGTAIAFGAGDDLMRFSPSTGIDIQGVVDGGGGTNTLEFASGASSGTLSGVGVDFVNFSIGTVDAGASWVLTGTETFAASVTLTNAGSLTLLDSTLSDAGVLINDGTIQLDPSSVTLASLAGTGYVTIGAGSKLTITGSVAATETIALAGGNGVLTIGHTPFAAQIDNFVNGDTIELTGITDGETVKLVNTDTLQITRSGHTAIDLIVNDTAGHANDVFAISGTGAITDETPCFLRGTHIRTEAGETPVEDLAIGDRVLTLAGASRPITWIGIGRVLVSPGRRSAATPIIVRKGALADNVPHQDLRITKGHALWVDGVLVPVEFLINHRSILWDDHRQEVEFYHIELETHDVLIANGAPSESYRDDGNRWLFRNANSGWSQPPKPPCAPVLTGGPLVDAAWRRLLDRNGPRPGVPLIEDPDLHLLVDGMRADATTQIGRIHLFDLPATARAVRLISRTGVPQELGLARDPRSLGVAVRRIVARQGTRFRTLRAADAGLAEGFHAFEAGTALRWTDGDAALPVGLFDGFEGAVELVLHLGASTRYPAFAEAVRRVAA